MATQTPGTVPATPEKPEKLPKYGYVQGKGKCRVLSYEKNGYFVLLTKRDQRLHMHRRRITFTNK